MRIAKKLRKCGDLTQELLDRIWRAYVFKDLPDESKTVWLEAEKSLLRAKLAFHLLAEYEEER